MNIKIEKNKIVDHMGTSIVVATYDVVADSVSRALQLYEAECGYHEYLTYEIMD